MAVTILVLILVAGSFFFEPYVRWLIIALAILIWISFYLVLLVRCVEDVAMYKRIPVSKLTEGDWIAKNVYVKKKLVCGPKDNGVSRKQINKLKRLKVRRVLIKEGIPFVPSFLIAFVVTLVIGNIVLMFI